MVFQIAYDLQLQQKHLGESRNMKKLKKGEIVPEDGHLINGSEKEFLDLGTSIVKTYLENKHCNGGCGSCQ